MAIDTALYTYFKSMMPRTYQDICYQHSPELLLYFSIFHSMHGNEYCYNYVQSILFFKYTWKQLNLVDDN